MDCNSYHIFSVNELSLTISNHLMVHGNPPYYIFTIIHKSCEDAISNIITIYLFIHNFNNVINQNPNALQLRQVGPPHHFITIISVHKKKEIS